VPSIKDAGDSAVLLELEPAIDVRVNEQAIAIATAIREDLLPGIRDVVPAYRSVAVYFDPLIADVRDVRAAIDRAVGAPVRSSDGRLHEIPVEYGADRGPDLGDVAAFAGITSEAVIGRHAEREYRVFMIGFLPGFAYLGTVDSAIAAPRRRSPRARVTAGSVGIAGSQTGVYPCDSPGGWQIIGRTPTRVFDPDRQPAALLTPGDRVRFRSVAHGAGRDAGLVRPPTHTTTAARSFSVIDPGMLTTIQDRGRWGYQASGVPVGGAMDWVAHRTANAVVGNDPDAATLEATLTGPKLRLEQATTIAVTGADLGATLDGSRVPHSTPVSSPAASILRFAKRAYGARTYVAFDGGIDVPRMLGSRSTHVLSRLGGCDGRTLLPGDRIGLWTVRSAGGARSRRAGGVTVRATGGARLRVIPGPQDDFFDASALEILQRSRFVVSPQSDRMGYRLHGASIARPDDREMISDAAFTGGVQVPPSGQPILLMADRQTTGGYPQIAVVITADLPLAAQLAPGDWVEFRICSRAEAISALVAEEARLLAFD
jgi:KipI family sensor histidine kinase inhibitor